MTNIRFDLFENYAMEDVVVNGLAEHRNEAAARRMLEQLTFRYAVMAKISITLRSESNASQYAECKKIYRRAKKVDEQVEAIREIIRSTIGWDTTVSIDDIAFYKPAFDELFCPTSLDVEYDADDVESMVIEQDFKCGICGGDLAFEDAEGAHLFAQVFFGNRIGSRNVYAAHKKCNCRQGISFVDVKYRREKKYVK